ncbi:MAG: prepilin-type N-terminal cleavage/methylation domain-containing protein [Candidatus Omnitrophota bacterium]
MRKKAFTLLEVIVGVILLTLVMLSVTNISVASRKYLYHSRARLAAANLGRMFLDPLQMEVRQDATDFNLPNCLNSGGTTHCPSPATVDTTINRITYLTTYMMNTVAGLPLRRVKITVHWTDV